MFRLMLENLNFLMLIMSLVAQLVKNSPAIRETWLRSLDWEDSPGEGKGYPLQYSGLENSMDGPCGLKESDTTEGLSLMTSVGQSSVKGMSSKGPLIRDKS